MGGISFNKFDKSNTEFDSIIKCDHRIIEKLKENDQYLISDVEYLFSDMNNAKFIYVE